ncbi:MAG: DUF3846 domain-containing protein [Oscillospiraceae bacterium]|nr:DUF3846 domain-containing protein [Oscillospiraceae bacterium]
MHIETTKVLVVEPEKEPYVKEISSGLSSLQKEVGGFIEAVYPFEDPVAIICNEEGKLEGLPLNRALRDEDGHVYDIIAGTFLIAGLSEDNFCSLDDAQIEKFSAMYKSPELFMRFGSRTLVIPAEERAMPDKEKKSMDMER